MGKRLAVAVLWCVAGIYAGTMLHAIVGLHELVGPLAGLTSGALIMTVPARRAASAQASQPASRELATPDVLADIA